MHDALLRRMFLIATFMTIWLPNILFAATEPVLRGARYCEIICLHGREIAVYDTWLLSDCPASLWKKLSVQTIKQDTKALYVYLNGPRRFTADSVTSPHYLDAKPKKFRDLVMHKVAVLHLTMQDYIFGAAPYHEHRIQRHSTWIYAAGKPVYELIDPRGQVYVMHSYTLTSKQRSEADLSSLGNRMQLPKNWQFKTGILQQETSVSLTNRDSFVVQDSMKNTYHKVSRDWL
jgi:hypothetical protein